MTRLFVDIETRARVDLKRVGVYRYVEDPEFQILMAAWALDNGPVTTALGEDEIRDIPGLWDPEVIKVAHNAQFERVCFSALNAVEWQDPASYHDTMAIAGERGLPQSLGGAARALRVTPKDSAGSRLINLFCRPRKDGGWNDHRSHPIEWMDFIAYCEQDVETLRDLDYALGPWPTPEERSVWIADQLINDVGIPIDQDLARAAVEAGQANDVELLEEFARLTGGLNPRSVPQVKEWADLVGLDLDNLKADTVDAVIASLPESDVRRQALEVRAEIALAAWKKFLTAMECMNEDGRVRGGFAFFGAHTGRWAGRGVQLQNLPRLAFKTEAEQEAAILDLGLGLGGSPATLKKLVRPLFKGPFTVVDYSAIEARVVAWLAGEQWALDAFESGRDIYVETAERMGGLTRFQGKVAVLALGYNGAVNSLRAMGAEGDDDELLKMVRVWRKANARIVALWRLLGDAIDGGGRAGPLLKITRRGTSMALHLPSGRAIHYHGLKWEKYFIKDTGKVKEGWRYADPKEPRHRIGTYGGRLTENATQAVARDLLAHALVNLQAAGYTVAAHVHDEVVLMGEHDVEEVARIMCDVPPWAAGLPMAAEGFVCERYRKG